MGTGEGDPGNSNADLDADCIVRRVALPFVRFSQIDEAGKRVGLAADRVIGLSSVPLAQLRRVGDAGLELLRADEAKPDTDTAQQ